MKKITLPLLLVSLIGCNEDSLDNFVINDYELIPKPCKILENSRIKSDFERGILVKKGDTNFNNKVRLQGNMVLAQNRINYIDSIVGNLSEDQNTFTDTNGIIYHLIEDRNCSRYISK